MHSNTFYSFIPQNLVSKKATTKTRREILEDLLSNDPRSKSQQVWTLEKKEKKKEKKKRGQEPRRRACRKIQNEDEVTVTVK